MGSLWMTVRSGFRYRWRAWLALTLLLGVMGGVVLGRLPAPGAPTPPTPAAGRGRGRDLAILKTLGLTRRQVLTVVGWQAWALAAVALAVGVPLGIIGGRWALAFFAGSVGVTSDTDIPMPLVVGPSR